MCIAWRKGVKGIWGLPFDTHNVFLPWICDDVPMLDELCFRSMGFVSNCLSSECMLIRFVTRHGLMSRMRSLVRRNTLFCQARYGQVVDEIMCGACSSRCIKRNYYLGDDEHLNRLTSHIKEVLSIRDDRGLVCPGFSNAEINYIFKYLCTCWP